MSSEVFLRSLNSMLKQLHEFANTYSDPRSLHYNLEMAGAVYKIAIKDCQKELMEVLRLQSIRETNAVMEQAYWDACATGSTPVIGPVVLGVEGKVEKEAEK